MTWVKIDDRYATHRKLLTAGAVAIALDVAGMCYCAGHNTDGHIPAVALTAAAPFLTRAQALAAAGRLVEAGRWKPVADGWLVHDYLTYNPSAAEAEADRAKRAEATKRWRQKQRRDASQRDDRDASPSDSGDDPVMRPPTPRGYREPERQLSVTPPVTDPSPQPPDAPPSPSPSGADSASDNPDRCRHGNDPVTCGICSEAIGAPPPREAISQLLGRRDTA